MTEKRDFLKVCNEHNVPFRDFEAQFCSRCLNRECNRSSAGQTKFEQRVANWETDLFKNVPQMDPSDPRLVNIRAKKFISIDPSPAPEVGRSAWVDPRDLVEPPAPPTAPEVAPEPVPEPTQEAPKGPLPQFLMNTPARSGVMVGGQKPVEQAPKADPWTPKEEPKTDGLKVVEPGARIRFDDSGV